MTEKTKTKKMEETKIAEAKCKDKNCNFHGSLKTRGKVFEGIIKKKFPKRIVIEFEKTIYIKKYERYAKSRTKVHARLPECMEKEVSVGDLVRVQECRPLSKIIHFVFTKKLKDSSEIAK
jgi:small subunit ribosomal protein S17